MPDRTHGRRSGRDRRRVLTLVAIALLAVGDRARAVADPKDEGARIIPSETCQGLWIVPMTLESGVTLRLVLDTGAEESSIDPDAALRVSGRTVDPGRTVRLRDARLGPLAIHKLPAMVHDMDHLALAIGTPIDGILGMHAFEDTLLVLDYPAAEVRVASGSLPPPDEREVFPDLGKRRPYLGVRVGRSTVPVLIDSGSTRGLTLRRDDPVVWETEPRPVGASVRYTTIDINHTGRARDPLGFGPAALARPIVSVVEATTRLAGHDLLRHFTWTFDRHNRRIRIVAEGDDAIAFEPLRGTGLALRPRQDGMEVVQVLPESGAAGAGVLQGDVILAADGRSVIERGCESLARPGRASVLLTIRRDVATLEIAVPVAVVVP